MNPQPLNILHVEDDADIRLVAGMAMALDPAMTVTSVESGGAALRMLTEGAFRPDLLLLDVMMPDMDGMRLVAEARRLPGMEAVPAIFLTARTRPGDIALYRAAGSLGLIIKPFDPVTLAQQIRALLPDPV